MCGAIVDDILPACQHPIKRKCCQDPTEVSCSIPCEDRLDCGHACTDTCHKSKDPDHLDVSRIDSTFSFGSSCEFGIHFISGFYIFEIIFDFSLNVINRVKN